MPAYPYTTVPGRIKELMEKLRSVGVPETATKKWLPLVGFKASNDPTMLSVLRFIGFINQRGTPSDLWRDYRGPNHPQVLAGALREAYGTLFEVHENAGELPTSELKDFFRAETGAAAGTVSKMVDTFKALCGLADFRPGTHETASVRSTAGHSGRPITVNININLPETENEEVYKKIFKLLNEYLLS